MSECAVAVWLPQASGKLATRRLGRTWQAPVYALLLARKQRGQQGLRRTLEAAGSERALKEH